MSRPEVNEPDQPDEPLPIDPLTKMDIDQWLEMLRRSDRSLYNTMALEVWSIAKTMDGLIPSFWNRFMTNRRISLQQFMQQKQAQRSASHSPASPEPPAPPTGEGPAGEGSMGEGPTDEA